jgi:hypothetical protein
MPNTFWSFSISRPERKGHRTVVFRKVSARRASLRVVQPNTIAEPIGIEVAALFERTRANGATSVWH